MKTLFAFVKWRKVLEFNEIMFQRFKKSRQDEFEHINKYFLYGFCKSVYDQVTHKVRNLQLKNKFGRETSLNVSSLVLPESVWVWPPVRVESQIHYWATSVTWRRCSSPAVSKCTCWRSDTVRHLQDKPPSLHVPYKDSGISAFKYQKHDLPADSNVLVTANQTYEAQTRTHQTSGVTESFCALHAVVL